MRREETPQPLQENTDIVDDVLLKALLYNETITREKVMSLPMVNSAVDFISNSIASCPVKLYKYKDDQVTEVDDERVKMLNGDTHDTLDGYQLKKAMVEDYLLGGNGYCYIRKDRNDVTGLFYVQDKYISIFEYYEPIFKQYQIYVSGYDGEGNKKQVGTFEGYEFIKLLRGTKDGASGTGLTVQVSKALETAYQTLLYQLGMVSTGGNKRGFLKANRKLGADEITALKRAWRNLYANNTENVVVLNNGLEFQEASNSAVETQLNESKKTLGDEINALFHIYPTDFDRTFKEALYPIIKAFETALNRDLLLEKEKNKYFFEFDVKEIIRTSLKDRYESYKLAKETGFMTLNEIRRAENMEHIEGLDVVNVGLGAVLYDVDKHIYYTPNTDTVGDIGEEGSAEEEEQKTEDMLLGHVLSQEFDDSGNSSARTRFNENHGEDGKFSSGGGGGSSSSKTSSGDKSKKDDSKKSESKKDKDDSDEKSDDKSDSNSSQFKALTNEEAQEKLGTEMDRVLSNDNEYHDMRDSLSNYSYGGHDAENKILRGLDNGEYDADDVEMFKEEISNIENAIDQFETKEDIQVFRKTMMNGFDNLKEGDTFTDDGFSSTSTNEDFVKGFDGSDHELKDAYMMKINVPKGKGQGAFIRNVSEYPNEYEFLLQRGSQFKVDNIDHDSKTMSVTIVGNDRKEL